eukprot:TRINITY_DN5574_c0_g1_i1.p1 TRINITY_DN5574_c0_g1~~TRINITY_DN5574_c0_g1_i1.p1  ORF type:complete len:364 (-),score=87.81 TRINITY_DN5574_c0_g1_i1:184-1275(-)
MSSDEAGSGDRSAKHILKLLCSNPQIRDDLCAAKVIPTSVVKGDKEKPRSTKKIVQALYDEIFQTGLRKMLECMHRNKLRDSLAHKVQFEDDRIPTSKPILVKYIHSTILSQDHRTFFEQIGNNELKIIMKDLEIDIPASDKDYVDVLLEEIEEMGLFNLFSIFNEKKLQEMTEACNLNVVSSSKETLMDCLISQEDFKPQKKKIKQEKASKKKPKIKAGITKVDLQTHFYRDELYDYCKEHDLNTSGSKKDYIARIMAHLEGRDQPKTNKKGAMLNKSKRKKRKTSSTDEEQPKKKKSVDKSEKSSKTTDESEEAEASGGGKGEQEEKKSKNREKKGKSEQDSIKEENITTTTKGGGGGGQK